MLPPLVKVPAATMARAFPMVAEGVALVPVAVVDPESDVGTIGEVDWDVLGVETCSL